MIEQESVYFRPDNERITRLKPTRFPAALPFLIFPALFAFSSSHAGDNLRQKIAQMFILGFNGTTISDTIRADLAERNLGGVIFMGANCVSPLQIQNLTAAVRSSARTPPFIAVDEEGGLVARLNGTNGFSSTSSEYQLGTVWHSADSTAHQATTMSSWLLTSGFTTDFAPVVDVDVNPQSPAIGALGRSYSRNPLDVALHSQAFIDRFHSRGLMTTLKHFPGHGSATTDSHQQLPDITSTWADSELIPYRSLIGSHSVDMVMVGHLYNAHIDSLYPTSLSLRTITGLLRDTLGYQGVVITDDLYNMKAITDLYGREEAASLSINAGADILLYVSNTLADGTSLLRHMVDTIEARVQSGAIPVSRIDESYLRIQALKARYITNSLHAPLARSGAFPVRPTLGNYPNPFNPATVVRYELPEKSYVHLAVYTVLGQLVSTLADGIAEPGTHEIRFDGTGRATGVYLARLTFRPAGGSGSESALTTRIILIR
ncbi:MAG TPA: glycoside hydrolase family 3 N-terminal domain-containing protein [Bacteroidota bacterium]|nr:glycoside hydrolase family 3 N-terminal domain-containing protein [Bacteroidota bacterium]